MTWRADRLLLALLVLHIAWGVARIPGRVFARRIDDVEHYHEVGAARFFLDTEHLQGAECVQWILDNVPEDAIVLWRGEYKGALEFVPPLVAPRLLVSESSCREETLQYLGRRLASDTLPDGRSGVVVLVGLGADLALEVR